MAADPLRFDLPVAPGGYAWWYMDAVSDDGAHGLTVILFVGSVFSSRYAAARRRDPSTADPERFCAVNVALYDLSGKPDRPKHVGWTLTEDPNFARDAAGLTIGASSIRWRDGELTLELDDHATRFFGRSGPALRGRVRLRPSRIFAPRIELDRWSDAPRHRWYPVAPHAEVEVELDAPKLRFRGSGYHDVNEGDEGLEQGFAAWNWSRCELGETTLITYDVVDPSGAPHNRAWRFEASGEVVPVPDAEFGPTTTLPGTRWQVERSIRTDPGHTPTLRATLEDTPFYSRNLVDVRHRGREGVAVHESVSLRRFDRGWVRFLLPFKIRYA